MKRRFHCKKVEELTQEVVIQSGAQRSRRDSDAPPKVMQRDRKRGLADFVRCVAASTSLGMTV
jgi:hypothetical protein